MALYLSLSMKNQFQFVCPIFNAKTKMAACVMLRDRVWAGFRPEKRKACQVAMDCSMCPVVAMVKNMGMINGELTSDDYGSLEPKVGRLHADILERIKNIIPIPSILKKADITAEERQLLLTTRGRIEDQLRTAPGRNGKATAYIAPQKITSSFTSLQSASKRGRRDEDQIDQTVETPTRRTKPTPTNNMINEAARTGDMSAAINAAAA
jgi:hypothetical protein